MTIERIYVQFNIIKSTMLHDMSNFDGRVLSVILSDSNQTLHELRHLYVLEIYNITLDIAQ